MSEQKRWLWSAVLAPFLATRMVLLLVNFCAPLFPANPGPGGGAYARRGWEHTPNRMIDVWCRWDTRDYIEIVRGGYDQGRGTGDPAMRIRLTRFPLYPLLVRGLVAPLAPVGNASRWTLLAGLLLSNACFIAALALLHQLANELTGSPEVARRTVLLTLFFPTAFIFSCFYAESLFLLLSLAAFLAARRGRWAAAAIAAALLGATRPLGVVIGLPLVMLYLEQRGWRRIDRHGLWFLAVPLGLLLFLGHSHQVSGEFLTPLRAQAQYGHSFAWPWELLLDPPDAGHVRTPIEQWMGILALALSLFVLLRLPSPAYGVYALLLVVPPLFAGMLAGTNRYYAVVFPLFVGLALLAERNELQTALFFGFASLQAVFFVAWARFYSIV